MNEFLLTSVGLTIAFVSVMVSLVTLGIIVYSVKLLKKFDKSLILMGALFFAWTAFVIFLTLESHIIFYKYILTDIFAFVAWLVVFSIVLYNQKRFAKLLGKMPVIIAINFCIVAVMGALILPIFHIPFLVLIHKIILIIPPLIGFFSTIKKLNKRRGR
jgi:hypothetical protein